MNKEYIRLKKTTVLFAVTNIAAKALKIIVIPLFTYYITTEQFGVAETVVITATLLSPVAMLGTNVAAIRFLLKDSCNKDVVVSNCFILVAITAFPMFLICLSMKHFEMFRGYNGLIWLIVMALAEEGIFLSFSVGLNNNKAYAFSEIVRTTVFAIFGLVFLIVFRGGIKGYLWAVVIASIARCLYIGSRLRISRYIKVASVNRNTIKELLKYSLPLVPAAMMWWVIDSSDRYIIMYLLDASSVGIYAIACRLSAAITGISAIFHQAWMLSAIREYNEKDYKSFYCDTLQYYSGFLFVTATLLIALIRPAMIVFDKEYVDAWRYAPLLIIAMVFLALSSFEDANYIANKKTSGVMTTAFVGAASNIAMNIVLTKVFGLYGTAAATLIAYYLVWLIRYKHTARIIGSSTNLVAVHINLLIVASETMLLLEEHGYIPILICLVACVIVNRKNIERIVCGLRGLITTGGEE